MCSASAGLAQDEADVKHENASSNLEQIIRDFETNLFCWSMVFSERNAAGDIVRFLPIIACK